MVECGSNEGSKALPDPGGEEIRQSLDRHASGGQGKRCRGGVLKERPPPAGIRGEADCCPARSAAGWLLLEAYEDTE